MNTTTFVQNGYISIDGDQIYYEVRGTGEPLLLIPALGGESWWFNKIANHLSAHFKVITYDMRGRGRSIASEPLNFEIRRHCDDVKALLSALGEKSVYIAAFSSGGVIALEVAVRYPSCAKTMLVFEPPMVRIHPRSKQLHKIMAAVYRSAFKWGPVIATLKFVFGAGLPLQPLLKGAAEQKKFKKAAPAFTQPSVADQYLEFIIVTNYLPPILKLKHSGIRIYTGAGKESLRKKRFYAQTAEILAVSLKSEIIEFPGHHFSFFHSDAEFAQVLMSVFYKELS